MDNHTVTKASEITGMKVKNAHNENLGEINDVVMDKSSGKVNYLVLDFGGFLSFGNKFFAVPWNFFTYNNSEDCFVINVDKETLKNAPGFDKDKWPNFASPNFTSSINKYYQPLDKTNTTNGLTTEIFNDKASAEHAYDLAIKQGYKPEEINVLMSEDSRKKYYDAVLVQKVPGNDALEGAGVGGMIGAAVGGTLGAVAAIGTSLILPGLGLIVAGPLAAGLAGAGAGGISGGLIGALVGWGIPEDKAKIYASDIKSGGIVLGVNERPNRPGLEKEWRQYSTKKIH